MKKVKLKTLFQILCISSIYFTANAQVVNYLDEEVFNFEDGGSSIYYQQTDTYWSISTDRSANGGSYSLKFSSSDVILETQKAKASNVNLPLGEYVFKVKVWLTNDADIKGFAFNLKNPWKAISIDIDPGLREQWVEINIPITIDEVVVNSGIIIRIDSVHIGNGTMYLDDFGFWGEAIPEQIELPLISSIKTTEDASLNLSDGVYDVNMKLWKDPGTTISTLYTNISEPWANLRWDIDTVTNGQWSELSQELVINDTVQNAAFSLMVNNSTEFGGGKGSIYIDDIEFIHKREYIAVSDLILLETEIILNKGDMHNLDYNLLPIFATDTSVTWISTNSSIASVNSNGEVTALSKGETTISIFSRDGYYKASCHVIVEVPVEGVSLSHSEITMNMGEQYQLTDTIKPLDASNNEVEWSSATESVASVIDGLVTGHTSGTALISVTTLEGSFIAQCLVTVLDTTTALNNIALKEISFWPNPFSSDLYIEAGDNDKQKLQLYSLLGILLLNKEIHNSETICLTPSYSLVPPGVYFLKLSGKYGIKTARIIRE